MPQLLTYVSVGYTQAHFNQLNVVNAPGWSMASHDNNGWFLGTGYEYGLKLGTRSVLEDRVSHCRLRH